MTTDQIKPPIQSQKPNFDDLPVNVVESIFNHLSYEDVTKARVISRYVYEVSGKYVKRSIDKLRRYISKTMRKICEGVNVTDYNTSTDTRHFLKIFSVLKAMEESLNMAIVLNRHLIERDNICLPIGPILDRYFSMLKEINSDSIKTEKLFAMSTHIQRNFSFIMDSMEKNTFKLKECVPLGVRTVDLLDLVQDISYNISANYSIRANICTINLKYHLENPKLLTYIPIVPYVKDCKNRLLTPEEQDAIMRYLIMLVNVHNKLEAKTDQYKRELEVSRRDFFVVRDKILLNTVLFKIPDLNRGRLFGKREILDGPSGKVLEIYKNYDTETVLNYGMTCIIKLTCEINDAPLSIKQSFRNLREDIEMEEESVRAIPASIFRSLCPSNEPYTFDFKLRVCIPSKTPEIFEINFQDGAF